MWAAVWNRERYQTWIFRIGRILQGSTNHMICVRFAGIYFACEYLESHDSQYLQIMQIIWFAWFAFLPFAHIFANQESPMIRMIRIFANYANSLWFILYANHMRIICESYMIGIWFTILCELYDPQKCKSLRIIWFAKRRMIWYSQKREYFDSNDSQSRCESYDLQNSGILVQIPQGNPCFFWRLFIVSTLSSQPTDEGRRFTRT